jgi:hypothetical protein
MVWFPSPWDLSYFLNADDDKTTKTKTTMDCGHLYRHCCSCLYSSSMPAIGKSFAGQRRPMRSMMTTRIEETNEQKYQRKHPQMQQHLNKKTTMTVPAVVVVRDGRGTRTLTMTAAAAVVTWQRP